MTITKGTPSVITTYPDTRTTPQGLRMILLMSHHLEPAPGLTSTRPFRGSRRAHHPKAHASSDATATRE